MQHILYYYYILKEKGFLLFFKQYSTVIFCFFFLLSPFQLQCRTVPHSVITILAFWLSPNRFSHIVNVPFCPQNSNCCDVGFALRSLPTGYFLYSSLPKKPSKPSLALCLFVFPTAHCLFHLLSLLFPFLLFPLSTVVSLSFSFLVALFCESLFSPSSSSWNPCFLFVF